MNTMVANALDSCVNMLSATMMLNMQHKLVLYLRGKDFNCLRHWGIERKCASIIMFPEIHSAQKGLTILVGIFA